jgi:hypothetical protein
MKSKVIKQINNEKSNKTFEYINRAKKSQYIINFEIKFYNIIERNYWIKI